MLDDGTATRFAPDRFFVTTTTANAARVMQHIDYCRQVLWPELDVHALSVTEQLAQYAVAGPNARALVQRLLPGLDLSNAAFPYMAACECRWRGVPARLHRLSFSGERLCRAAPARPFGISGPCARPAYRSHVTGLRPGRGGSHRDCAHGRRPLAGRWCADL